MVISKRKGSPDQVIAAGAPVKSDTQVTVYKYKILTQKVRQDILKQVDQAVLDRPGMSRNAWIQEAIQEKLSRNKDVYKD